MVQLQPQPQPQPQRHGGLIAQVLLIDVRHLKKDGIRPANRLLYFLLFVLFPKVLPRVEEWKLDESRNQIRIKLLNKRMEANRGLSL